MTQLSHVPYLELKLPPPFFSAHSKIAARQQSSHVLAMSFTDMGCDMLRKHILNLVFAFAERSSESLLQSKVNHPIQSTQKQHNTETQQQSMDLLPPKITTKYSHLTSTGNLSRRTGEQFG